MLNLDNTSVLTTSLDEITDKNLFAYCDNNPIMREDLGGDFWGELALAGGGALGASWSFGGANFWNPVGWVVLGVATVATVAYGGYTIYKISKSEREYNQEAEHTKKLEARKINIKKVKAVKKEIRVEKKVINVEQKKLRDM